MSGTLAWHLYINPQQLNKTKQSKTLYKRKHKKNQ